MELIKGNSNIQPQPNCEIMSENQSFELWGTNWRIGRSWGLSHPNHTCYCDGRVVQIHKDSDGVRLGIGYDPKTFIINEYPIIYPWMVGYISSIGTVKYGMLSMEFILPRGRNLWPALWLTDCKTWPPEIDIVEGWTNTRSCAHTYRKYLWGWLPVCSTDVIFPGLVTGNTPGNKGGKSYYNLFHGVCSKFLNTDGKMNRCVLEWMPNSITMWYNGHEVMHETDPEMLRWFNASEGMEIHLDNYVTNGFTTDDFKKLDEDGVLAVTDLVVEKW